MADGTSWAAREAALRSVESTIAAQPNAIEPRFERARLLTELRRDDEARAAYLELLAREPTHFGGLSNLGTLLLATGYRRAAHTAYAEAVARHPGNPAGHVNLANLLGQDGDGAAARAHYETALRLDPEHRDAHRGLAQLLTDLGEDQAAERHFSRGFAGASPVVLPYRGDGVPLPILLLVSARGGNIPLRAYLDDRTFQVSVVFAEFCSPVSLPPHRLVLNAIGDADRCGAALDAAEALGELTTAGWINHPARVRATTRERNAERLADIPDLVTPRTITLTRDVLLRGDAAETVRSLGFGFPLLVRSPGFHTGQHFRRIERARDLAAVVETLPGDRLTVIEYLDARGVDGSARKYRVMFVGGRLFPLHLAVSRDWKVHYVTADMADCAEHRAEEARFLADMPGVIGSRAVTALEHIRDVLALDYAGVDFGLDAAGRVLLFEANATMVVNTPGDDLRWAYRRPAFGKVSEAIRTLLVK